jgi:Phospholipase_D-nuclease N-terminal
MLDKLARHIGVSPLIVGILIAVAVVQIAMQVYALVDLARRDVVEGGNKWVWLVAIALGNLLGTIAYLAVGRPAAKVDTPRAAGANTSGDEAARRAVDVLYNPRDSH